MLKRNFVAKKYHVLYAQLKIQQEPIKNVLNVIIQV